MVEAGCGVEELLAKQWMQWTEIKGNEWMNVTQFAVASDERLCQTKDTGSMYTRCWTGREVKRLKSQKCY